MGDARLYVGGLGPDVEERDLEGFFRDFGRIVDIKLMRNYAFVEFSDSRDAKDAQSSLDGRRLMGESVRIEVARGPARERRPREEGARNQPRRTGFRIAVDNLSSDVSWQDLKDFMRQVGVPAFTDVDRKGRGIVEMSTEDEMRQAISELDGQQCKGQAVKLTEEPEGSDFRGTFGNRGPPRRGRSQSPGGYSRRSPPRRSYEDRGDRGYDRGGRYEDRGGDRDRGYDRGGRYEDRGDRGGYERGGGRYEDRGGRYGGGDRGGDRGRRYDDRERGGYGGGGRRRSPGGRGGNSIETFDASAPLSKPEWEGGADSGAPAPPAEEEANGWGSGGNQEAGGNW